ncbi:MAG: hypothetical protein FWC10_00315 [Lentimicrobiaceae bacterium]|nr:hypothetical protein [Lentimicrobiaceae bacterium]
MKNYYLLIFLSIVLILNFSCKKPDITPAYLILSEEDFKDCIDVSNFNNTHDQNYDQNELDAIRQQKFTDVLVSLNGKELGYWNLPCKIPLLPNYSDSNNIRIIPCVRIPHTSTTTTQYHFVTPYEKFFAMNKEGEYQVSDIKLKYVSSVDFSILETFTQSTDFSPRDSTYPATIQIVHDDELNKNIGKLVLADSDVYFDIVTPYFTLLGQNERQFWEISYKSVNGRMTTYLGFENTITGQTSQSMVILPSTQGVWKKIYINITDIVMQASYTASKVSTRLQITGIRDSVSRDSEFYFENIKLITMDAPYY